MTTGIDALDAIAVEHRPATLPPPDAPETITARALADLSFPPVKYVVPQFVCEGLTLLAGKPKLGKSWLCMDVALAVASGGVCLGNIQCEQGDALYLALEDNRRRLQSRIARLWTHEAAARTALPDRLHLATEWPRAGAGGVERIAEWIDTHPGARLVIVDVLAMFKAVSRGKEQTLYEGDYAAIKDLQSLAMATGVAIIVVHHTRKSGAETDPFEKVSGTLGLSGAADTTLILDRDGNGCTIYGRGRDIQEIESAVEFDAAACRWNLLGDAAEVRRTDERGAILRVLGDADEPMGPTEVSDLAGMSRASVRKLLARMVRAGEVVKPKRGLYAHPEKAASYADKRDPDKFVPP